MKSMVVFLFALSAAMGPTGTGGISGTVVDAETQKPVPGALVMAVSGGPPRASKNTKSGGDEAFQIGGLAAGTYALCVQAAGDVAAGRAAAGGPLRLRAASAVTIEVQDAQNVLSQRTRDGRGPELTVGVWGPRGIYHPARASASPATTVNTPGMSAYRYVVAVPRDTVVKFHIASRDVRLGDSAGVLFKVMAGKLVRKNPGGSATQHH